MALTAAQRRLIAEQHSYLSEQLIAAENILYSAANCPAARQSGELHKAIRLARQAVTKARAQQARVQLTHRRGTWHDTDRLDLA